ncbi:hypothetical protein [Methanosphaerula palustris]|uniref:Uncharacterized protein n=1 Tax=Methanosphaerula palustris (strain ATCC BAA-1556 / DSM 19958 / E1-9c) TaxID=521011 RepID=B8GKI5_METPE|nr:conserved hypothetical protein [Methanosphaerula palustris E1-9c]
MVNLSRGQWAPSISGDRVVWQDYRSGAAFDIYMRNLTTDSEQVICADPGRQWLPKVSGDLVTWVDSSGEEWTITAYNLTSGVRYQFGSGTADQCWSEVSDGRVVWMDYRDNQNKVYLSDLTGSNAS